MKVEIDELHNLAKAIGLAIHKISSLSDFRDAPAAEQVSDELILPSIIISIISSLIKRASSIEWCV